MDDNKIIEWLCGVLDDTTQDSARRIDAGITLLMHAARLRNNTSAASDKKLGVTLAVAVRGKLSSIVNDEQIPMEQRIRAAGAAL